MSKISIKIDMFVGYVDALDACVRGTERWLQGCNLRPAASGCETTGDYDYGQEAREMRAIARGIRVKSAFALKS